MIYKSSKIDCKNMSSLFNTSSNVAGFRLQYMEVYNWGTFHDKICRISPQGNNSLLTGANASGKSTLIDALVTLLVPAKKDRFYNQSSGTEKKGDRTEETYVLGNYGNIQREGESGTTTQRLRDKDTYSIILASFANKESWDITLFQVRWFANGELRRSFGIAREPLEIKNDFPKFDGKGAWKKELEKKYNSNSAKKRIEFFNGPTEYGERIWNWFGMRSIKGLMLFNQIVGVKVLDDLDNFIRTNMLEENDAENEYVQLKENFQTLMEAKINIDKTIEQIEQLKPIDEIADKLFEIAESLDKLQQSKEKAVYWFAQRKVELAEKELEKCIADLKTLKEELGKLREEETELKNQETDLTVQIKTDAVGNQIEKLKAEIARLESSKNDRSSKLDSYNKIAQKIKFTENPNEEIFISNRERAKTEKDRLEKLIKDELSEDLRLVKNKADEIKEKIETDIAAIQSLQKYKNNISGKESEIRDLILENIGAAAEEIPFIGELIRVKDDEKEWELSIEKILHNFALRLIVPEKHYGKVNEFVNTNNLKGRIIYQRYKGFISLKELANREVSQNSLLNKIEFKPKNNYTEWLEDIIYSNYNYACVDDLSEFNRYEERAVTKEGLIKSVKGKHEKDDRPHILRRENYLLGWDNKEKIRLIQEGLRNLQGEQKQVEQQIHVIKKSIDDTNALKDDFSDLFKVYAHFDDIDWQSYAKTIQEKREEKTRLEAANDKAKELQKQLERVQKDLKQLSEIDIENKNRTIFQTEQRQKDIEKTRVENTDMLNLLGEVDVAGFEQENPDLSNLLFENIESKQTDFQTENQKETDKQKELRTQNERSASKLINIFKNPPPEITDKFKDWRSDVHSLPDSTNIELIGEYQSFYRKLIDYDLVRFEKKFNDYLQETVANRVSEFRMFFENWRDSITENIRHLNESLKEIDFNNNPTTYIQLVASSKIADEVQEFRNLLDNALPNKHEISSSIDGQKNHFNNHIQPFIKKLEDEQWRKKVMEVRTWFNYKAEEFYKETKQKYKTYESMGQLSGGEKAQLTYTILGSAIAYQFGLTKDGLQSASFRFIAIDEAFKAQDEDKARYLISLCKQLHLQLLVVTPSDNIHIVENDISFVHYVERNENESILYDMPIEQFKEEQEKFINANDYSE